MYLVKQSFAAVSKSKVQVEINYQYLFYESIGIIKESLERRFVYPNSEVFILAGTGEKIFIGSVQAICQEYIECPECPECPEQCNQIPPKIDVEARVQCPPIDFDADIDADIVLDLYLDGKINKEEMEHRLG